MLAVMGVAFWFLGVDRSWFVEECPTCGYGRDVLQYRVFTIPIYEQASSEPTLLQAVAKDLGVPCPHTGLTRWHKHRYWGLGYCVFPCINGTYRIGRDFSWYDDRATAELKKLVKANPRLPEEFAERVLKNRDWNFWSSLIEELQKSRH